MLLTASPVSTEVRARALIETFDDLWRGTSSRAKVAMTVKTEHYTRSMRMEVFSKGEDYSLVRLLSPIKEKGTATLKSKDTLYTYLPRTDRTIRLTSAMMGSSWMGSHFTNDDLVKESRMADDYVPSITFEGNRGGTEVFEISMIPKADAAVVWGKVVMVLEKARTIPITVTYYDEDGRQIRVMEYHKVKKLAGRDRPTVFRLLPTDKPDEYTELVYEALALDVAIEDAFFSLARLRRR